MIPSLPFGRTGHISTRVIFGAAALSRVTQAEADRAVETLMKYGVNHIDTSESYGDSERLLGPWRAKYRDKFFLATKTDGRTYQAAKESIQRSLERLRTDYLDLIQLHAVISGRNNIEYRWWGVRLKKKGLGRSIGRFYRCTHLCSYSWHRSHNIDCDI